MPMPTRSRASLNSDRPPSLIQRSGSPPVFSENISLAKCIQFPVSADRTVDLFYQANALNLLNRTIFGGIVSTVGNGNFGRPPGRRSERLSSRWFCVWNSNRKISA